jgi:hypothetical protein
MIAAAQGLLKFSPGVDNIKLARLERLTKRKVSTFSLVSGETCPYANECLAKVVRVDGRAKMWYGPEMKHVCYSASLESIYPTMLAQREYNSNEILTLAARSWRAAADLIVESIPKNTQVIRIHVGGDFKTRPYFRAWCAALADRPDIVGYAYTKSLPFWVLEREAGRVPRNFLLTASYGGKADPWIKKHNLRYVKVVKSVMEAHILGLPIDHDDRHAAMEKYRNLNFALLIHGKQRAGSDEGKAVRALRGKGSYSRVKKKLMAA